MKPENLASSERLRAILCSAVLCAAAFFKPSLAWGANVPLPGWTFTVTGPGSGSGNTNASGGVGLSCSGPSSGTGTEVVKATSAADILTVTTNTTYVLSAWGSQSGPSGATMSLLVNGGGVATVFPANSTYKLYVASFTTGGPGDSRVGLPLRAEASVGAGFGGGGSLSLTNMVLSVLGPQPELSIRHPNSTQIQLSWRTNYINFSLESAPIPLGSSWDPVTNSPLTQSTDFVVTLANTNGPRSFRLHSSQ